MNEIVFFVNSVCSRAYTKHKILIPHTLSTHSDAAKRKKLPVWIREGLEKMEREKQRELEKQRLAEDRELARKKQEMESEADPTKSKFVSFFFFQLRFEIF